MFLKTKELGSDDESNSVSITISEEKSEIELSGITSSDGSDESD